MPALDPLPPVMTPVASAPADAVATPALHARYLDAQTALETHLDARDALLNHYARIARAEGVLRRRQFVAWSSAAARARVQRQERHLFDLEMERVGLEEGTAASLDDVLLPVGDAHAPTWRRLLWGFHGLTRTGRIWDVTGFVEKVPLSPETVARSVVSLTTGRLDTVRPDLDAPRFENVNGPTLWLYPEVLALQRRADLPALVDLREVEARWAPVSVYESGQPPDDAHWRLVKHDEALWVIAESPPSDWSRRPHFRAKYAFLRFTSARGLHEAYLVSSRTAAKEFVERFDEHQHALGRRPA